jgi:hypothetical protein
VFAPHRGSINYAGADPSTQVEPVVGQWFQDENGAVISTSLWRQLGADAGIVGKPLTLDHGGFALFASLSLAPSSANIEQIAIL